MRFKNLTFFAALYLVTGSTYATDQQRQGFIFGLGIGPHNLSVESDTADDSYSGIGTSFMIGGGITNQFALYYANDVEFFTVDGTDAYGDSTSDIWIAGLTGIGLSYYFAPQAPSAYIGGAMGLSSMSNMSDSSVSSYMGSGFSFTVGYEFARRFGVELNLMRSSVENEDDSSDTLDLSANRVLFKWVLY